MDSVGYNGRMTVEGETLILTHDGFVAKVGGLSTGHPRRISLQAISAVAYKPASRMANGWLTLGLGGAPAAELGAGTAASNPDTVMFRHQDNGLFESLFVWLQTVVTFNRDHQIDSSSVAFDPAPATRQDRMDSRIVDRRAELKEDLAPQRDGSSPLTQAPNAADLSSQDQGLATPHPAIPSPTTPAAVPAPSRGGRRQRAADRQSFEALAMSAALGDAMALQQLPAPLAETSAKWRKGKLDAKLWDILRRPSRPR